MSVEIRRRCYLMLSVDFYAKIELQRAVIWLPNLRLSRRSRGVGARPLDRANFTGLVLGCVEAKFCKKIYAFESSRRDL